MTCTRAPFVVALALGIAAAIVPQIAAAQQPQTAPAGLSSRRTTAVTYEARRTTKVDLMGTPLLPRARGEVEIKTESAGPVRIKAKVRDLSSPIQFGPEYLTYVLWTIPPKGRAKNLGELRLDGGQGEIEATSDAQTFALIVTAEPYYAVTTPGDVVVMENAVRRETRGDTSMAVLEFEIVPRGAYVKAAGGSYRLPPVTKNEPPDVSQARNAVAIARFAEADRLSAQGFGTAQRLLGEAEQLVKSKGDKREIISQSRAAVQAAEEARLQAVARGIANAEEAERAAATAREQAARDKAATETAAREAAVEERKRAEQAAQESAAERQRAEEAQRNAESARADAEKARAEADSAREEAESARKDAENARATAEAEAARAEALRAKAEQDKVELRARLLKQFSDILETRDTTRGLVVNVGDVLFETGRYELKPLAREKLARFAGIVLAHPGLAVQAEGFTDSTGTAAINEKLSQQRADAVGEYLVAQGVTSDRVTARGYGPSQPVAPNETREGRQKNRRVELVVAGEVIGTPIGDSKR
jgi:outer membrane protein OmpA-like peptidoglycan-associated protein